MHTFAENMELARTLAQRVRAQGGTAYFVGGFVRDALRGAPNKDLDIEVHGLAPAQLAAVLDTLGARLAQGESFGIYTLKGWDLDIAMPRREHATGRGHRDFDVLVDPFLGPRKAAMRRDFTINAMMQDVLTGELLDPFGGQADLAAGVLRHVSSDTFGEDPLRVLRAAQFAARFGFAVADETTALCRGMDLRALSRERVLGELAKALLKSDTPSRFFAVLRQMDQLGCWFGEAADLIGVPQNPRHHAEGDVWTHTLMVLDTAAGYRGRAAQPLGFMLAALVHDFGKAVCTETVNGAVHAYGHETAGLPLAKTFLRRLTNEEKLIAYVLNLAEYHMKPNTAAAANASLKATNRLFDASADPEALICLGAADGEGKIPALPTEQYKAFLGERLRLYRETMAQPGVMGRDLIAAGLAPGPDFSACLAYAHKLQLAGIGRESALKQTLSFAAHARRRQGGGG